MSAAENKRSVIVGIFVFLAIVIFVVGIFTLAGQQKRLISNISVRTVFDDVGGLQAGNNVWSSGVKVGTVKDIRLIEGSQVEIFMNIEEKAQPYIRKDAIARISSESFIGNKNIVIEGGSPQAPPIEHGDVLKGENPLDTDELMATLQQNNENLVAITGDFKKLSSRLVQGEGTVGALLTDSTMANDFQAIVSNLQQTSSNTVQASRALSQFTTKLNTQGGLIDKLVTDTAVFNQLQVSVAQLQQTTNAAAAITENLQKASSKLNQKDNALGVMLNDQEFATQMKSTMQNLETSTEKLDENMEALQHNFLFRGFFRRKAREEEKAQE